MSIVWTIASDPDFDGANAAAAAFNGSTWVVSCESNFLTSPDTTVWTSRSTPSDGGVPADVVWCDSLGLFVAAGFAASFSPPLIMTSPDGITWTGRSTPWDANPGTINGLGWSHDLGQIVACGIANPGSGPCFMTSPDGVTWTQRSSSADNGAGYYRAAWSSDLSLWVAVGAGGDGGSIMTSPDGVTWTTRLSGGQGADVCWSHDLGLFVVAGDAGGSLAALTTSPDGTAWTDQTTPTGWGATSGVIWDPFYSLLIADHGGTNGVLTSPDGVTWTVTGTGFLGNRLFASGSHVVVAGWDAHEAVSRILVGSPAASGPGLHVWHRL